MIFNNPISWTFIPHRVSTKVNNTSWCWSNSITINSEICFYQLWLRSNSFKILLLTCLNKDNQSLRIRAIQVGSPLYSTFRAYYFLHTRPLLLESMESLDNWLLLYVHDCVLNPEWQFYRFETQNQNQNRWYQSKHHHFFLSTIDTFFLHSNQSREVSWGNDWS